MRAFALLIIMTLCLNVQQAYAEALTDPSDMDVLVLHAVASDEKPDFMAITAKDHTLRRFDEFERKREHKKRAEALEKRYAELNNHDRIILHAGEKVGSYDFDKGAFVVEAFDGSQHYPFTTSMGRVKLVMDNAKEFHHWKVSEEEAEAMLKTMGESRDVTMEIEMLLVKAETANTGRILHGHIKRVAYKKKANQETIVLGEVKTSSAPAVEKEYASSASLKPADIDYRGLKIGMSATEFKTWASENGAKGKIHYGLRKNDLPQEQKNGMFGSKKWAYMDSNIERMNVGGGFSLDNVSCDNGIFCGEARFDEAGNLLTLKFRDRIRDTKKIDSISTFKEKYGKPVHSVEKRFSPRGDMFQRGATSIDMSYVSFGGDIAEAKPAFTALLEGKGPLTLRIGAVYSDIYIEGQLGTLN